MHIKSVRFGLSRGGFREHVPAILPTAAQPHQTTLPPQNHKAPVPVCTCVTAPTAAAAAADSAALFREHQAPGRCQRVEISQVARTQGQADARTHARPAVQSCVAPRMAASARADTDREDLEIWLGGLEAGGLVAGCACCRRQRLVCRHIKPEIKCIYTRSRISVFFRPNQNE